jgi:uncharacterized protein
MDILSERKALAIAGLRRFTRVVVALSGGVDSAVLLSLAAEALGAGSVRAVTGLSGSLPRVDLEDACAVAAHLGVEHQVIETLEMARGGYRANAGDRCFHCRSELFETLRRVARREGCDGVVYGAIKDDCEDFRPGMRAAEEWGVRAPLLEAGIDKANVRRLAARAGLSVHAKPAAACLASRIPIGTEVTVERLGQVEAAERALRGLGFEQLRVRHHGEIARLELDGAGLARMADHEQRSRVTGAVKSAGFRFVAVDLEGYRSGSLNAGRPRGLCRIEPTREGGQ